MAMLPLSEWTCLSTTNFNESECGKEVLRYLVHSAFLYKVKSQACEYTITRYGSWQRSFLIPYNLLFQWRSRWTCQVVDVVKYCGSFWDYCLKIRLTTVLAFAMHLQNSTKVDRRQSMNNSKIEWSKNSGLSCSPLFWCNCGLKTAVLHFFPLPTCRPGMYSDFMPCHKAMVKPKVATQPGTIKHPLNQ